MQVVKLKFMRENVANDLMRSFGAAFGTGFNQPARKNRLAQL